MAINPYLYIGKTYGKLTVVSLNNLTRVTANCDCSCGNTKTVNLSDMKQGKIKSCGCFRDELMKANKHRETHGQFGTKLYNVYSGIKARCYNKDNKAYSTYGAKGVTMCQAWLEDFLSFKAWAEDNGYEEGLTIDKDRLCELNNISPKIYSPTTCEWVTRAENTARRFR